MSEVEPEEWSPDGLVEHVHTIDRKSNDRRFAFILGAGASVQSGIDAAGALVRRWLGELHRRLGRGVPLERWATADALGIAGFSLDRAASFYSQVFARRFRQHPDEGYADLEDIMQGKDPSFGYSVLAHILAETRHKLVITTNFDNLVSEALSIFTGTAPLVCGHESLAAFIRVIPRRPVVVKIHRDLLMAPMNLDHEIAALQGAWIEPLTRVFATYTPIVIGYGGNDGSLMNFLHGLGPGAIAGGIFWCYYGPGGRPGREICELVAKHRGALVPIEGFDELMLRLGDRLRVPLLDSVLESKARARLENYRRRVAELTASIFARPAVAAVAAEPAADDEAEDELAFSPPPAAEARADAGPAPTGAAPGPVPSTIPAGAAGQARAPVPSTSLAGAASQPPTPQPSPAPTPAPTLSSPVRSVRPSPPPTTTPREVTRGPRPALDSVRGAEPPPPPPVPREKPQRRSAAVIAEFDLDEPRDRADDDAWLNVPLDDIRADGPLERVESTTNAGAPLQQALQRLAADAADTSPWSALLQAHAEPDRTRGVELLRTALVRFPGDPEILQALAERLLEVPSVETVLEAVSLLKAILHVDAESDRALRHLALVYAWLKDMGAANAALRRAWALVRSPPAVAKIGLLAFTGGLLARLRDADDTRALAILKSAVLGRVPDGGLPQPLVEALLTRLDPASARLYSHLLKMFAGRLRPGRVAAFDPRFAGIDPADLGRLGDDDLT